MSVFLSLLVWFIQSSDGAPAYSELNAQTALYYSGASYCATGGLYDSDCSYCKAIEGDFSVEDVIVGENEDLLAVVGYDAAKNQIVIAFRGTIDPDNWWKDFNADPIIYDHFDNQNQNQIHEGFYVAYKDLLNAEESSLKEPLIDLLNEYPESKILVTGHSLGGAIATVFALDLKQNPVWTKHGSDQRRIDLYTFGSPRLFQPALAKHFQTLFDGSSANHNSFHWRITNNHDPVPQAMISLGYTHVSHHIAYFQNEDSELDWIDCAIASDSDSNICNYSFDALSISDHTEYLGMPLSATACHHSLTPNNLQRRNLQSTFSRYMVFYEIHSFLEGKQQCGDWSTQMATVATATQLYDLEELVSAGNYNTPDKINIFLIGVSPDNSDNCVYYAGSFFYLVTFPCSYMNDNVHSVRIVCNEPWYSHPPIIAGLDGLSNSKGNNVIASSPIRWKDAHPTCTNNNPSFGSNVAWCAAEKNTNSWLQVDLQGVYDVRQISTKGRGDYPQWVKRYDIFYSVDGIAGNWNYIDDYPGNYNQNGDGPNFVNDNGDSVLARYLKFYPTQFHGWPSMRVEAYGQSTAIVDVEGSQTTFLASATSSDCSVFCGKFSSTNSWCSQRHSPWYRVDLKEVYNVFAVGTKGRPNAAEWVKSYKVQYRESSSGAWKTALNTYAHETFTGNTDQNTAVIHTVKPDGYRRRMHEVSDLSDVDYITARQLRFLPVTFKGRKSMRVEVYGHLVEGSTFQDREQSVEVIGNYNKQRWVIGLALGLGLNLIFLVSVYFCKANANVHKTML